MFSFPPLTPLVKKLIIALLTAYVVELVLENFLNVQVMELLALDPLHLGALTLPQLATHVFVPDRDPTWMLISLVFMWLILSPFEASFGPRRTIELTIGGALAAALTAILTAQVFPGTAHPYVGSSSIAFAGMAAITQVIPRNGRILLFGAIPMTPKQALIGLVAISGLQFLFYKDLISLTTTLAAIGAGLGYVSYMRRPPRPPRSKRTSGPRFRVVRGGGGGSPTDESDRPKWLN